VGQDVILRTDCQSVHLPVLVSFLPSSKTVLYSYAKNLTGGFVGASSGRCGSVSQ